MAFIALGWPALPIFGESFRFCSNRVIQPNNGINTGIAVIKYQNTGIAKRGRYWRPYFIHSMVNNATECSCKPNYSHC